MTCHDVANLIQRDTCNKKDNIIDLVCEVCPCQVVRVYSVMTEFMM